MAIALTKETSEFQLGHFFSEMDSFQLLRVAVRKHNVSIGPLLSRNGQNRWMPRCKHLQTHVSIGPLLSRNGQPRPNEWYDIQFEVSIGPLLSRNGQFASEITLSATESFQLGHFLAEMDRMPKVLGVVAKPGVSIGPLLSRNGQAIVGSDTAIGYVGFQLGHFLAEMDRG